MKCSGHVDEGSTVKKFIVDTNRQSVTLFMNRTKEQNGNILVAEERIDHVLFTEIARGSRHLMGEKKQ